MRVFVTGLTGFVGRWLHARLVDDGQEVLPDPSIKVDVTDREALIDAVVETQPDAVAHLAAVSSSRRASEDPAHAYRVAVGGTVHLMEAIRSLPSISAVLVVSSSEVYGHPAPGALPLREDAPLRPRSPYALAKTAQESVALAYAAMFSLPVAVARSFNHIGPGQRPDFVVPAIAGRVLEFKRGELRDIPVGNRDVRRDFTDVRDVAAAYALILRGLVEGSLSAGGAVLNVASGRSTSIDEIISMLCASAGVEARVRVDPALVRTDDPPDIVGDASALRASTGWRPHIEIAETLRDVWEDVLRRTSVENRPPDV